jgi:DNA gyrase subunit A
LARRKKAEVNEDINIDEMLSNETIVNAELSDEIEDSMLNYSVDIITARALPNVFDGCKPVIRRILYGCHYAGYLQNKKYVKNALVVGNIMGTFHPHGSVASTRLS